MLGSKATMGVWFAAMLGIGVTLLARHEVAFPRPKPDAALTAAMASLRAKGEDGRFMAVHVLSSECRCSQRIGEHLAGTRRPDGVVEHVILVGHGPMETKLARFGVTVIEPSELTPRYRVGAAPTLLVTGPDGSVRYVGGYTERKQGPAPRDREIIDDIRAGRDVESLPTFGCAVDEKLQAAVNPLRLP